MSDEIVISGCSGRLPESSTVQEFRDNLFAGVDMVNDDPRRWRNGLYGTPTRAGKLKDVDLVHFDAQFFKVHQKQAETMDPQIRILLEATYEAIVDAGYNPIELIGSRTGVYIGAACSEIEEYLSADPDDITGYEMTGCLRAMFANRVSFAFDFRGPSLSLDTACSSSMVALVRAFEDIRAGRCDAAIVGGATLNFNPLMTVKCMRMGLLSADGKCRSFDANGCGFVRSEGVPVVFLQRAGAARRVYASVLNAESNTDGNKEQGITFPSGRMQLELLEHMYKNCGVNPADVAYIEAHGTGTQVGDPQEVNALTDFFCLNRPTPLLIGSVKSNIGHAECASGLVGVAKVLIAMEEGVIPGNLHFEQPNPQLYGIVEGSVRVVDRNTPWRGGIVGVNSFGFGGVNAHVILKSNPKRKQDKTLEPISLHRLVNVSGRTREGVELLLAKAKQHKDDDEFLGLVNAVFSKTVPAHGHRGYAVIGQENTVGEVPKVAPGESRPVWYIYSGLGSQWVGMAKDLMHLNVFRNSVERSASYLRPEGYDLIDIVTRPDSDVFSKHIDNSFVAITAMQIALTDLLSSMDLTPSGIIGHSFGELACAYADGCLSAEQTILTAYWRGKISYGKSPVMGMMASVGLSWDQCQEYIPVDVFRACHNSKDNVTISGPRKSVASVIKDLQSKGIFAKTIETADIAFHSKYVQHMVPSLRSRLSTIIPKPKNRSTRWVSTSIPEANWNSPLAQQFSAEYHINNMLSPVWFADVLHHVPENAICIEIAPDGQLQAILKRSLGEGVTNLCLMSGSSVNNQQFLLQNIGKLYVAGALPNISVLYNPVVYPVGRGTPMLNSSIGWDHSQRFLLPTATHFKEGESGKQTVKINLETDEHAFHLGHRIDRRVVYSSAGYIALVWKSFVNAHNIRADETPITFDDVVFHDRTILVEDETTIFYINFLEASGLFEVSEKGKLLVSGRVSTSGNTHLTTSSIRTTDAYTVPLNSDDVYKELRIRGYDYTGAFRCIITADASFSRAQISWNNWTTYIDGMLQLRALSNPNRSLYMTKRIGRLTIDPRQHLERIKTDGIFPIVLNKDVDMVGGSGVEIQDINFMVPHYRATSTNKPVLLKYVLVPFSNPNAHDQALEVVLSIVVENSKVKKLKIRDVTVDVGSINEFMAPEIERFIDSQTIQTVDLKVCTNTASPLLGQLNGFSSRMYTKDITKEPVDQNCHLVTGYNVLTHRDSVKILANLRDSIKASAFILLKENIVVLGTRQWSKLIAQLGLVQVSVQTSPSDYYILLRPQIDFKSRNKEFIVVTDDSFDWLHPLQTALATAVADNRYVYIVCMEEPRFGAVGFFNCIKLETGGQNVRLVDVRDHIDEPFSFENALFQEQLQLDLIVNVYTRGEWGSFHHLPLEDGTPDRRVDVEHAHLRASIAEDVDWLEAPLPSASVGQRCSVYYSAVNTRDVSTLADGHQESLGIEFAGRNASGKRVMSIAHDALATTCLAHPALMWEIPDRWTMEQASSVPFAYCSAYYALIERGNIQPGDTILITNASECVGLAAISIALSSGLSVFASVRSAAERVYLLTTFPELIESNISTKSSASTDEMFIMNRTNGIGVNLVLNLHSDMDSVKCLSVNGRFLQMCIPNTRKYNSSCAVLRRNRTFHTIDVESVINGDVHKTTRIANLMNEGIKSGVVQPLATTVFTHENSKDAFEAKTSCKHIGKILIKIRNADVLDDRSFQLSAIPRTNIHADKSYILVGGLGGFGLEVSDWLITRGATKLILNSRHGVRKGYQRAMVQRWINSGVQIIIDTNDSSREGVEALLQSANQLGPIGGIFNVAVVLRDNSFELLHADDFQSVSTPKSIVTHHLDVLSRVLCKQLDHFVCFSSCTSGCGNVGQSNYGLTNSAMERICASRHLDGLPGLAIQWGPIGDTGIYVELTGTNDAILTGFLPQRMVSCLRTLDYFLRQSCAVVASFVVADKRDTTTEMPMGTSIASLLGIKDVNNIPDEMSFGDLGMDSLMGVEIKAQLDRNGELVLSMPEIRQLTFGTLKEMNAPK